MLGILPSPLSPPQHHLKAVVPMDWCQVPFSLNLWNVPHTTVSMREGLLVVEYVDS